MSNILIAYFSRAGENYFGGEIRPVSIGNTKICAELLKESLDADAFEIEMKHPILITIGNVWHRQEKIYRKTIYQN